MAFRDSLKRLWKFFWHSDSPLAWILNIVVAFVLIKFLIYPGAGLLLGTDLPVVAVVSSSMDHRPVNGVLCGQGVPRGTDWWEACGEWYEEQGFTEQQFTEFIFPNGFWKGDVMILSRFTPEKAAVGDVVVFQTGRQYPIIHRLVAIEHTPEGYRFTTKGDHNEDSIEQYAISDGRYLYSCYTEQGLGRTPSLCGPGTKRVTDETPGAMQILDETGFTKDVIIGKAIGRIPFAGWLKIWFVDLLELFGLQKAIPVLSA